MIIVQLLYPDFVTYVWLCGSSGQKLTIVGGVFTEAGPCHLYFLYFHYLHIHSSHTLFHQILNLFLSYLSFTNRLIMTWTFIFHLFLVYKNLDMVIRIKIPTIEKFVFLALLFNGWFTSECQLFTQWVPGRFLRN